MLNTLFQGVFTSTTTIQIPQFLLCIAISLAIGLFLSFLYLHKSHYTKSFVVTLALLPAVVCVVIMMVNGNVGAGVAAVSYTHLDVYKRQLRCTSENLPDVLFLCKYLSDFSSVLHSSSLFNLCKNQVDNHNEDK